MSDLEKQLGFLKKENKYLSQSLERLQINYQDKIRELSILRQIGDTLSHQLNLRKICTDIIDLVLEETDADNSSIMLLDKSKKKLKLIAAKGKKDKKCSFFSAKKNIYKFNINEGVCGLAINKQTSVIINNADKSSDYVDIGKKGVKIGSLISLPLISQKKVLGVINLSHSYKNFFSKEDERILIIIASQAALVLDNAQLLNDLKTLNEEMRESEEKYRNLFENSVESIIILDRKGNIKSFNKAFEDTLDISLESAINKPLTKFIRNREEKEFTRKRIKEVTENKKEILFEKTITTKTENKIFEIKSAPVFRAGRFEGVQEIWRDITERKMLQIQLIQSQKLASVGYLVSGIAHELNNPLAIILGYAELVEKFEDIPPKIKGNLLKIIGAAKRSRDVIKSLMSFSGKGELSREKISPNQLIRNSVKVMKNHFDEKNINVELNLEENVPPITGDENQLRHVLLNIYQNAIDSMYQKNNKGKLKIKSSFSKNNVIMEFIDNGKGINPEIREKIFDPFFTTKEVGKGLGLGMCISYGIIKNHNGVLYFDPNYNEGAKFIIKLPVIDNSYGHQSSIQLMPS